jgi:hypothetical protein
MWKHAMNLVMIKWKYFSNTKQKWKLIIKWKILKLFFYHIDCDFYEAFFFINFLCLGNQISCFPSSWPMRPMLLAQVWTNVEWIVWKLKIQLGYQVGYHIWYPMDITNYDIWEIISNTSRLWNLVITRVKFGDI